MPHAAEAGGISMTSARFAVLGVCLLAASVMTRATVADENFDLQTFLASNELEPVRSPDRVESQPVEVIREPAEPGRLGRWVFRRLPEPLPLPGPVMAELSSLLLAAESYLPAYKFCGFQPVIAFRFWRGPDAIDVLICFKCSELAFEKVGTQSNLGRKIPFDPSRAKLARLVRQSRPDDQTFKDIK